ncbi:MAG TPA: hypothetical protein VN615_09410, partial [Gaiellales bacterium]|nr:hypothetical protein [Gaiellales bacterium]
MSQMRFEVFTLGTLVMVIVFALVSYALGADVRRRAVDVSLVPVRERDRRGRLTAARAYQPVRRTSSSWSTKKSALSRVMQSGGFTFSMFRWS